MRRWEVLYSTWKNFTNGKNFGTVLLVQPKTPTTSENSAAITGTIRTTGKGMGFVTVAGQPAIKGQEVVIEPDFIGTALNGDEVEIIVTGKHFKVERGRPRQKTTAIQGGFQQMAGQVVRVISRAKTDFVGELVEHDGKWWVRPDDRRAYADFLIPESALGQAKKADAKKLKVVVRLVSWQKNEQHPTGEIIQVIGQKGVHETEIQSIILDRGIDVRFPEPVMAEAEQTEKTEKPLRAEEITRRRDFRQTLTVTIDPIDAKDFDDAISFKKLPADSSGTSGNRYEIGVHIADVSYYVRPGTALDYEAAKRSFSVYLVDRTIPMLPEVLSNDLCSLNPNEDRFAFSAVFVMDDSGTVHERWFGRTVINSAKRFSYESAQETLNGGGDEKLFNELTTLNAIAKKMQAENYRRGAIDFAQDEVKFKLDENGKPIAIVKKERLDTHKLVEEYMLLANREVAEFIFKKHGGAVGKAGGEMSGNRGASIYRIHDVPDGERLTELGMFLQALGYHLPVKQGKITAREINILLKSVEGVPEESLIKTATIRSMAKAAYSTQNIGHFGLGFSYYTHFTSPIRRYTDLVVHRVLADILENKPPHNEQLEKIADHASDREILAAEAERASIKFKQVEYMSERIGKEFSGTISGVTDWGIYIEEVETRCEGMVPLRELSGNDFFIFNPKTYTVEGERTRKKYRLGDSVRFKVVKADLDSKTLDYRIV
jgi:ribonuclease R